MQRPIRHVAMRELGEPPSFGVAVERDEIGLAQFSHGDGVWCGVMPELSCERTRLRRGAIEAIPRPLASYHVKLGHLAGGEACESYVAAGCPFHDG